MFSRPNSGQEIPNIAIPETETPGTEATGTELTDMEIPDVDLDVFEDIAKFVKPGGLSRELMERAEARGSPIDDLSDDEESQSRGLLPLTTLRLEWFMWLLP
jgi:hypothetical protein